MIPSRDIDDQRVEQSCWRKAYSKLIIEIMYIKFKKTILFHSKPTNLYFQTFFNLLAICRKTIVVPDHRHFRPIKARAITNQPVGQMTSLGKSDQNYYLQSLASLGTTFMQKL